MRARAPKLSCCRTLFGRRLFDQEIFFFGLAALRRRNHPARHPAPTRPRVPSVVAILDGHFSTPALAITLSSEELMNVEPVLFGDTDDLLANRNPLRALLPSLYAFNVRLHL